MPKVNLEGRSSPPFFKPIAPQKWTYIQIGSGAFLALSAAAFAVIFFTPQISALFLAAPGATGLGGFVTFVAATVRKRWGDYVFSEEEEKRGSLTISRSASHLSLPTSIESAEEISSSWEESQSEKSMSITIQKENVTPTNDATPASPTPTEDIVPEENNSDNEQTIEEKEYNKTFSIVLLRLDDDATERQEEKEKISLDAESFKRQIEKEKIYLQSMRVELQAPSINDESLIAPDLEKHKMKKRHLILDEGDEAEHPSFYVKREEKQISNQEVFPARARRNSSRDVGAIDMPYYTSRIESINEALKRVSDSKERRRLESDRRALEIELGTALGEEENREAIRLAASEPLRARSGRVNNDFGFSYSSKSSKNDEKFWNSYKWDEDEGETETLTLLSKKQREELRELEKSRMRDLQRLKEIDSCFRDEVEADEDDISVLNMIRGQMIRILEDVQQKIIKISPQRADEFEWYTSEEVALNPSKMKDDSPISSEKAEKSIDVQSPQKKKRKSKKHKKELTGTESVEKHFKPIFEAVGILLQEILIAYYSADNPQKAKETEEKYIEKVKEETVKSAEKISNAILAIYELVFAHVQKCETIASLKVKELGLKKYIEQNFNEKKFRALLGTVEDDKKFSKALRKYLKEWKSDDKNLEIIRESILSQADLFKFREFFKITEEGKTAKTLTGEEVKQLHPKMMQFPFKDAFSRLKNDPLLDLITNFSQLSSLLKENLDFKVYEFVTPFVLEILKEILTPSESIEESLRTILKTEFILERVTAPLQSNHLESCYRLIEYLKGWALEEQYKLIKKQSQPKGTFIDPELLELEMDLTVHFRKPIRLLTFSSGDSDIKLFKKEFAKLNNTMGELYPQKMEKLRERLKEQNLELVAGKSKRKSLLFELKNLQGGKLAKVIGGMLTVGTKLIKGETIFDLIYNHFKPSEEELAEAMEQVDISWINSKEMALLKKQVCLLLEGLIVPLYKILLSAKDHPLHEPLRELVSEKGLIGKAASETFPKLAQSKRISLEKVHAAILDLQSGLSATLNPNKINFKS